MTTFLMAILGVVSLIIIVAVLLQTDSGQGASALGGGMTAAAKKAKGYEALLNRITLIASIVFAILTLVILVIE